ncbi:high mobility group box domain-containing protein, partial [Gorgonomyces haynaldii]
SGGLTKKKRTRAPKDPSAPKHPMSAFLYYLSAVRHKYTKSRGTAGHVSKLISESWKTLSEDEKSTFQEMANKDKSRYAQEMQQW